MVRQTRQRSGALKAMGAADSTLSRALAPEVMRVPVRATLYQQAMAENGEGDRPRPIGPALPFGHVCYRQ